MKMLEHLTLSSGQVCNSPRSEPANERVDKIRSRAGGRCQRIEGGWFVDFLVAPEGTYAFDLVHERTPAVRCWLCTDGLFTAPLWAKAKQADIRPGTPPLQPQGMPWLASALLPGAVDMVMSNPRVLAGVASLERCLAWALIEA